MCLCFCFALPCAAACSSDTSSELSSEGPDASYSREYPETYGRPPARPRLAAIYEPHASYCPELRGNRERGPLHAGGHHRVRWPPCPCRGKDRSPPIISEKHVFSPTFHARM